jgi:hypothetical protein
VWRWLVAGVLAVVNFDGSKHSFWGQPLQHSPPELVHIVLNVPLASPRLLALFILRLGIQRLEGLPQFVLVFLPDFAVVKRGGKERIGVLALYNSDVVNGLRSLNPHASGHTAPHVAIVLGQVVVRDVRPA